MKIAFRVRIEITSQSETMTKPQGSTIVSRSLFRIWTDLRSLIHGSFRAVSDAEVISLRTLSLISLVTLQFCCFEYAAAQSPASIQNVQASQDIAFFTPPKGWMMVDKSKLDLPPLVRIMVVGKSSDNFPPSINLTSAPYQGTLKQYLEIVKLRNLQNQCEWKDLGIIRTQAGNASLSQIDSKSQWGEIRQMHVIYLRNGIVYIITAAALKSDFSLYYQDFFQAMRSFRVSNNALGIISNPTQKNELQNEIKKVQVQWKLLLSQNSQLQDSFSIQEKKEKMFNSEPFQSKTWNPFQEMIQKKFVDLGLEWQSLIQQNVKDELFAIPYETKANIP